MRWIYLHGFASSPSANKARAFGERLAERGVTLEAPDLNVPSFEQLTLSAQIARVKALLEESTEPATVIASSMGALVALRVAQDSERISRLILLAPAFGFLKRWRERLGPGGLEEWRQKGYLEVPHFGYGATRRVGYSLMEDAELHDFDALRVPVPTLAIHGMCDEVVDFRETLGFARRNSGVEVCLLDGDHGLADAVPEIWARVCRFI